MPKLLDILICSLNSRKTFLDRLCSILQPQISDDIGIICDCDDGEVSIGMKRNRLLANATAEYVAFVDDDDRISDNYCASIIGALQTRPDCVGIEGIITFDGQAPKKFIHSLKCGHWHEDNTTYYRTINHLNPIKRTIAIEAGFPDQSHGEDSEYSSRLAGKLKTEIYIEGPIYYYDFRRNK